MKNKLKELLITQLEELSNKNVMEINFDDLLRSLKQHSKELSIKNSEELEEIQNLINKILRILEDKKKLLSKSIEQTLKGKQAIKAYRT